MPNDDRAAHDRPVFAMTRRCALSGADAVCVHDLNGELIRVLCPAYDPRTDLCKVRRATRKATGPGAELFHVGNLDCEFV